MHEDMIALTRQKYRLPYHWIRDPLHHYSLPYFGYIHIVVRELPPPPAHIFDAGCGDGRVAKEVIQKGYQIVGVDFLELSVVYAQTLVPEGTFVVADLTTDLKMEPHQFDAAILIEVYEHIPSELCPVVLTNLYRVLRPGGRLIISVPTKIMAPSNLHYRHFDRYELEEELMTAGFHITKIIRQHQLDGITKWLLSDQVNWFLNNRWIQPQFLKRLRHWWYMRYANEVKQNLPYGRLIVVAER